ncbi:MAG: twin-arginine translocase subunit TatC [Candidatus Omnitrophica bacterium]|nr:twin-arginine translocase subunit TatC [Candidatus Omnitrophota bacterium]
MVDEKKPIFAHMEELRGRVLVSIASVAIFGVLSYIYAEKILMLLARHAGHLVFISPQEAFLAYLKIALFGGLVLSAPVILFNALRFVWVAFKKSEQSAFVLYFLSGVGFFISGVIFAYFIVLPAAMKFLLGYASDFLSPCISVSRYVNFSFFLILAFAMAFETPLVVLFLTRLGVVNASLLRRKRKYFIVGMFIVAAVLTPPDVITQILLALPLIALYEISVLLAGFIKKVADPAGGTDDS